MYGGTAALVHDGQPEQAAMAANEKRCELREVKAMLVLEIEERERAEGTLAMHGREQWPWHCGRGDARLSLTPSANRGEGMSTRRRKARRS
jgi:hypothetical protein